MSRDLSPEQAHAEAVCRIYEVRDSGKWWLDLGDLPIKRVPDEIALLKDRLRLLALGKYKPIVRGEEVEWEYDHGRPCSITDVVPLAVLTGLTNLDLSGCEGLTSVAPLAALTGLTNLNLTRCAGAGF
jgi:Leucine-rich repeat (LRR) protein